jgi:hypothetical protein
MSRLPRMKEAPKFCLVHMRRCVASGVPHVSAQVISLALLTILAISWMCSVQVDGQTAATGAISGTITDPSGAVLDGAKVTVTSNTTGATVTAGTSHTGNYLFPLLPPGSYRVEASKPGFKLTSYPNITVNVTETQSLNIKMVVGGVNETVQVSTEAEPLQLETSALGHVVGGDEVRSLPLVTRNYTQILGLSPGVSAEVFNAGEIGRGGIDANIVVSGAHASDNNFQMNGVEINDLQGSGHFSGGVAIPNPDSIQEFKVQTSQYDASYGRNAGGNVDVVTKAGTNDFHGSLWEFFRNEKLNANDYFRNQTSQPRPVLRQNQFGFTFGGPIVHEKLLFFTSYQGTRQLNGVDPNCSSGVVLPLLTDDRSPAGLAAAVGPDTEFAGGDPLGRTVAPDGSNISPQTVAILNRKLPNGQFVVPNPQVTRTGPTGLLEGFSSFSDTCKFNEDQFMTNFDWLHTQKSTLQARFFFANSQQRTTLPAAHVLGASSIPGFPSENPQQFRNLSLSHTYVLRPALVNQAEFGFHRTDTWVKQSQAFSFSDIGSTVPAFDNPYPVIAVGGGINLGGNGQSLHLTQNTFVVSDNVFWTHGRHSMQFGGSLARTQDNFEKFTLGGILVFLDYPSFFIGQAPLDPFLVEDLAGLPDRAWRVLDTSLYAQDNFKVTSRLTLNLGFRYERLGDFGDSLGRNSTVDPSRLDPNPPDTGSLAGIVVSDNFPGTRPDGVVSSGNNLGIKGNGQNTLNPRIGFTWRLPGTERLLLRGGYGVYHQRATGQPYLQQVTNQPFGLLRAVLPNFTGGFDNPFPPDPGAFPQFFPYSSSTLLSVLTLDPNLRPPVLQRYSLNLQTELTKDMVLEVGYAGMRGTHLLVSRSANQAALASIENPIRGETTNTLDNVQQRVPFVGWSAAQTSFVQSTGFSWYNSLEASLRKRFSHGLQFLASYTFSRSLSNTSDATTGVNGGTVLGDQNDPRRNYGPDSFVREHRFVFSGLYEFPGLREHGALLRHVTGGWKLAGVTTIQSGQRLTVNASNVANVFGIVSDFPVFTPGCRVNTGGSATDKLNKFFNTGCFSDTYPVIGDDGAATGFGNGGVGTVRGPSQVNTDLSLIKLFAVPWPNDAANIEFRTEFFNAFNHPVFDNPDVGASDGPAFGQITNTVSNPRLIQFALKLNF